MYISESFLTGFIVIVVMIVLLIWAIRKSNKSDMKHNKPKSETPKYASEDKEPSDLKYDNEVYISFKNTVKKAYESYERSGYKISWEPDMDGFYIVEDDEPLSLAPIYAVNVNYDNQNLLELDNPFYIVVSYGIIFDKGLYDFHKKKAEYLNSRGTKRSEIFYSVDTIHNSNFMVDYANFIVTNNKVLYEKAEKIGEAELFLYLFAEAKQAYHEGDEIYCAKLDRDEINSSN